MLKRAVILVAIVNVFSINASWAADNWEYQGRASTGEGVSVNLDSVTVTQRSLGLKQPPEYSFTYKIGRDQVFALTGCNDKFSTSTNGKQFNSPIVPTSQATRNMIDRVCSYRVRTAQVFSPPSNVRIGPDGNVLCTLRRISTITTYGRYGDWFYTDVCGRFGLIHSSQIR